MSRPGQNYATRVNFQLKMQSENIKSIVNAMSICVKNGRDFQYIDPNLSMIEIEKLAILSEVLASVRNFESKLLSDLDVD